jgi:hypothetical protein
MKQAELVIASNELNDLLFDPKKKEDGWIDVTGKNIKKMIAGIKEAAEILEPDEELTEETLTTLRKIDWSLDDYDEDTQKDVQKNLQKLGVWLNDEENGEETPAPKKKKPPVKKKAAAKEEEPEENGEEEVKPKAKKGSKATKKSASKTVCICLALSSVPKKGKTVDEIAAIADEKYVKAGGDSNIKQTTHHTKVLLPAAVEWGIVSMEGKTILPGA